MSIIVKMTHEKECKHSVRFKELSATIDGKELPYDVLGTVYLRRAAMRTGDLSEITITLDMHS